MGPEGTYNIQAPRRTSFSSCPRVVANTITPPISALFGEDDAALAAAPRLFDAGLFERHVEMVSGTDSGIGIGIGIGTTPLPFSARAWWQDR